MSKVILQRRQKKKEPRRETATQPLPVPRNVCQRHRVPARADQQGTWLPLRLTRSEDNVTRAPFQPAPSEGPSHSSASASPSRGRPLGALGCPGVPVITSACWLPCCGPGETTGLNRLEQRGEEATETTTPGRSHRPPSPGLSPAPSCFQQFPRAGNKKGRGERGCPVEDLGKEDSGKAK